MTGSNVDYTALSDLNFLLQLISISILREEAARSVITAGPVILPRNGLYVSLDPRLLWLLPFINLPSGVCQTLPIYLNSPRASIRRLT